MTMSTVKTAACRIRARAVRPGEKCLFCLLAEAKESANDPQSAIVYAYALGHFDEVAGGGPVLCQRCLGLVRLVAKHIAEAQGTLCIDVSKPNVGKT
jgi:hypothetical protein